MPTEPNRTLCKSYQDVGIVQNPLRDTSGKGKLVAPWDIDGHRRNVAAGLPSNPSCRVSHVYKIRLDGLWMSIGKFDEKGYGITMDENWMIIHRGLPVTALMPKSPLSFRQDSAAHRVNLQTARPTFEFRKELVNDVSGDRPVLLDRAFPFRFQLLEILISSRPECISVPIRC